MYFYFSIAGAIAALIFLDEHAKKYAKRIDKALLIICFAALTVIACIRGDEVGSDTSSYMLIFDRISITPWNGLLRFSIESGNELGYVLYNKILAVIIPDRRIITVSNSLILMAALYIFLKRNVSDGLFGLYAYYTLGMYQSGFNIVVSQCISLLIFSNLDKIREHKKVKYFLLVCFCMLFHISALIYFAIYFVCIVKLTISKAALCLAGAGAISLLYDAALPLIVQIIPQKYIGYLDQSLSENGLILLLHLMIVLYIFGFQMISQKKQSLNSIDERQSMFLWLICLEFVCYIIAFNNMHFSRAAYLFMPAIVAYIPNAVDLIKSRNMKIIYKISMIIILGVQYWLRLRINNIGNSIPYYTMFD